MLFRSPLGLTELGELEQINPTMLSRVIGRLVEMDLITRTPDPADLRSVSVVATATGRRVDKKIKARRAAAVSLCLESLPADQVAALTEALPALENLAETMRRLARAGAPDAMVLGRIEKGRGVRLPHLGLEYEGYGA